MCTVQNNCTIGISFYKRCFLLLFPSSDLLPGAGAWPVALVLAAEAVSCCTILFNPFVLGALALFQVVGKHPEVTCSTSNLRSSRVGENNR